nr:ABC transporter permease [Gemmatimonadota bacterium]
DQTQVRIHAGRPPWEGKPEMSMAEGAVLAGLPTISSLTPVVPASGVIRYQDRSFSGVDVIGLGAEWTGYVRGDFVKGRNFLPLDIDRSASVTVISEELGRQVFGDRDPTGHQLRIGPAVFRIVGVYRPKPNLFQSGPQLWAYVPATSAVKRLRVVEEWTEFWVVPGAGVPQARAMDDVITTLRALRGLGPGEENNFALVRQEAFADLIGRITGAIYLVMLILSSVGLLVGGVGVVAIMMISVTERTREIGVRKALGATRREILWQFLVESMTVTTIGGAVGLAMGAGGALLLAAISPIPAAVPLWSIGAALAVSAVTGIGFGLYPANKAARLDPVEALRYE